LAPLQKIAQHSQLPGIIKIMEALEASYRLRLGDLDDAIRWANASRLSLDARPAFQSLYRNEVLATVRLAESRGLGETAELPRLLAFIDHLLSVAKDAGHKVMAIRLLLLRAMLHDLRNEREAALGSLFDALQLSEAGSIIRLFVDGGRPIQKLLEAGGSRQKQQHYVRTLLLAFAEESGRAPEGLQGELPEKLTDREYEVLKLIAAGHSNRQIQDELVISKNTVRTHIKHLYGKLGVSSRTQAVKRANELGLLSP
jgi:LuxR family maltose regulon positive regulatory protein